MPKCRIGVVAVSDSRSDARDVLDSVNRDYLERTVRGLEATGLIEPVVVTDPVYSSRQAVEEARRLASSKIDGTIINFATWSFPSLAAIIAQNGKGPFLLFSNLNPQYPGLVAMLASGGALEQIGIKHQRIWGEIQEPRVIRKVISFCRAARVVNTLRGQVCGLIGGRSMGMYTATVDPSQWQQIFGVDVEHIDQLEIIRRAQDVPVEQVERAVAWLEKNIGYIAYDGNRLTREKLAQQVRSYYATQDIIEEYGLDFLGVKCHPELSGHFVTQCLSQAFFNDPYDWDGRHEPTVFSCEADMDGAMTMQTMKLLTGEPVLFMDFRHYDASEDVFVFCNCGSQATYYANRSDSAEENLRDVHLYPSKPLMKGGGAHVQYVCAPGTVTIARLLRSEGRYKMAILKGEFVRYPREKCRETTLEWPTAFVRLEVDPDVLIASYSSNHCHAVYGDWIEELKQTCQLLGIEVVGY
ncbi:MAG: L-fucose/L-arabinose isomerase family protein [Bacillota bacterium]